MSGYRAKLDLERHGEGPGMAQRQFLSAVAMALVATLLSPVIAEDSLDRRMGALSPDAHDCGRTNPSAADRGKVLACVESQVQAGTPFRVRLDDTCVDSICAWGLLREKPGGQVRLVPYEPKACTSANESDPWCGTFADVPCKDPQVTVKRSKLRVDCADFAF